LSIHRIYPFVLESAVLIGRNRAASTL
jgi:hypothetical protein